MRFNQKLWKYSISFCIETTSHLLPHNESNQVFHIDFNIYYKGDKDE